MLTTRKNTAWGFTIVELIVIIVVIGILAGITAVSYTGYQQRANKSAANATVQQVKLKLGEYFTDNNRYPANSNDVNNYLTAINAAQLSTDFTKIISGGGTYVAKPAGCASTGNNPCTSYTITVPITYWKGGSTDTPIVVMP